MLYSYNATVTDGVLKLGYTSVIFVDLEVGVDGLVSVTEVYCLSYVMSLASLCFRKQCPAYRACYVFRHLYFIM